MILYSFGLTGLMIVLLMIYINAQMLHCESDDMEERLMVMLNNREKLCTEPHVKKLDSKCVSIKM